MKISTFKKINDYRTGNGTTNELNLVGSKWNLRVMFPNFGLSIWKDQKQKIKFNYPST